MSVVAVSTTNFAFVFPALTLTRLREQVKPGQTIMTCPVSSDVTRSEKLIELLQKKPAPTALIGICIRPAPKVVAAYSAAGVPIVLIDEEVEGTSTVTSDNVLGGELATEYLLGKGRKRLGVVAGRMSIDGGYNAAQRVRGVRQILEQRGLAIAEGCLIEVCYYSHRNGVEALTQLLDEKRGVDAIFCAAGDTCASGILSCAQSRGLKIPQELALVGYDDHPLGRISTPPLTTVRKPLEEIAAAAYRMATEQAAEILAKPQRTYFKPQLVVRESA